MVRLHVSSKSQTMRLCDSEHWIMFTCCGSHLFCQKMKCFEPTFVRNKLNYVDRDVECFAVGSWCTRNLVSAFGVWSDAHRYDVLGESLARNSACVEWMRDRNGWSFVTWNRVLKAGNLLVGTSTSLPHERWVGGRSNDEVLVGISSNTMHAWLEGCCPAPGPCTSADCRQYKQSQCLETAK